MALRFGKRTVEEMNRITVEQLQITWERALRQLDRLEERESLLDRQRLWLKANRGCKGWGIANEKHQRLVDDWYGPMMDEWHRRCTAFDRLGDKADAGLVAAVHPYAKHGARGLYQVRSERAKERAIPVERFIPSEEPPF